MGTLQDAKRYVEDLRSIRKYVEKAGAVQLSGQ
jgi:hypothetical protein